MADVFRKKAYEFQPERRLNAMVKKPTFVFPGVTVDARQLAAQADANETGEDA